MTAQNKNDNEACCDPKSSSCNVEAIVSVDSKGRILLPSELRQKGNVNSDDKFAVVSWKKNGDICCFSLIKVNYLGNMVRNFLGPMMKELTND
ncbi:MAG: AbrB family transcriptional regulator [Promethearchaeota archaeon]|nr:MAG: AbrB family transcriptional regulator [Candidatus Lokiarchaeota archaeon]